MNYNERNRVRRVVVASVAAGAALLTGACTGGSQHGHDTHPPKTTSTSPSPQEIAQAAATKQFETTAKQAAAMLLNDMATPRALTHPLDAHTIGNRGSFGGKRWQTLAMPRMEAQDDPTNNTISLRSLAQGQFRSNVPRGTVGLTMRFNLNLSAKADDRLKSAKTLSVGDFRAAILDPSTHLDTLTIRNVDGTLTVITPSAHDGLHQEVTPRDHKMAATNLMDTAALHSTENDLLNTAQQLSNDIQ